MPDTLDSGDVLKGQTGSRYLAPLLGQFGSMFLRLVVEIYQVTGEEQYLNHIKRILRFLEYSQLESGEL